MPIFLSQTIEYFKVKANYPQLVVGIVTFLNFLTYFTETPSLNESDIQMYFMLKMSSSVFGLIYLVFLYKKVRFKYSNYIYVLLFAYYTIGSSLYSPWYIIAVFDLMIVFIFLFPVTKKEVFISSVCIFTLYTASLIYRHPNIPEITVATSRVAFQKMPLQIFKIIAATQQPGQG